MPDQSLDMTEICHICLPNLGEAGRINYSTDEQDCHMRHNCTQDVVRRYDGRHRSGGADFLRSEEALLRRAARRASATGRGDRTFAARGAFRGVLRLHEGSGDWLYHTWHGRGDGWRE